jgi:hypothetical protein
MRRTVSGDDVPEDGVEGGHGDKSPQALLRKVKDAQADLVFA